MFTEIRDTKLERHTIAVKIYHHNKVLAKSSRFIVTI